MKTAALEKRVAAGERVLLDTSTLVAYFNGNEVVSPVAQHVIDVLVHDGRNAAVVSALTAAEVFVLPLRAAPRGLPHIHAFLTRWPNLSLMNIDLHVAQEAATVRAAHGFKTPDAVIIASGIVAQVAHLVTNDAAWNKKLASMKARFRVCELANYA
ncbi:MAG: PIN domain-containing protein [Candidatus Eremiobacteraeota bacterium]|nr:PIN domain-containing protein [Candidatus Eremiobacteraeota bacterium]MBC5801654.1 PIN domain-containing protein [Candidatus Eremiobacteraeota bacterium]MBC5824064.1 PIN domain-containing protein [Candidatus Eremiobacteraeota bacterium]